MAEMPKKLHFIVTLKTDPRTGTVTGEVTKEMELPTIEELMEPMCDQCQWPGWYKDPDDMMREKCSCCPVERKLAEVLYGETD